MENNQITWKIGGIAGAGIMSTGLMFSKICTRHGLQIFDYIEYPSLIRGGHNAYVVRAEEDEVLCQIKLVDVLIALNKETIDLHMQELTAGGALIYDGEAIQYDGLRNDIKVFSVPLHKIVKEFKGEEIMINTAALGASLALLDADFSVLEDITQDIFGRKGDKIVRHNVNIARAGYNYLKANYPNHGFQHKLQKLKAGPRMVLTGNEALALGAIQAGLKFYSAYPMTPASSVLHLLAAHEEQFGLVVKQPEDEIAAINMAIGASFAGVRAMTGTSGGGFCLMAEGVGLAGITETPIVILVAIRGGPSTGLPTWTEQSDLKFIINVSHGEFPRVVIAPGDQEEMFYAAGQALNLAEKYQMPVIIISDKYLSESHKSHPLFDVSKVSIERGKIVSDKVAAGLKNYERFAEAKDGVSPRCIPGQKGGVFMVTSDEHNKIGLYDEEPGNRIMMMDKRMRKQEKAAKELPEPKMYGSDNPKIILIGFGSVKGPVLEALKYLKTKGVDVAFLHVVFVYPFPSDAVAKVIGREIPVMVLENDKTGQFASLIRENILKAPDHLFLKYDGRPFYPEEIADKVMEVLGLGRTQGSPN